MKNFIQDIKKIFDIWIFDWRKKRAITKAQRLANEQRRKFLVLVYDGKPVAVSMQSLKHLIRTKRFRNLTPDMACRMAIYIALPKQRTS